MTEKWQKKVSKYHTDILVTRSGQRLSSKNSCLPGTSKCDLLEKRVFTDVIN